LAGIWESEDMGTIEFFSNGTLVWGGYITGTWTAEKNRLMIDFGGMAEGGSMDYKLSGKTLTLTDGGQSMIFTKK
jgi:hypothetical protein